MLGAGALCRDGPWWKVAEEGRPATLGPSRSARTSLSVPGVGLNVPSCGLLSVLVAFFPGQGTSWGVRFPQQTLNSGSLLSSERLMSASRASNPGLGLVVKKEVPALPVCFVLKRMLVLDDCRHLRTTCFFLTKEPFTWRLHAARARLSEWADKPALLSRRWSQRQCSRRPAGATAVHGMWEEEEGKPVTCAQFHAASPGLVASAPSLPQLFQRKHWGENRLPADRPRTIHPLGRHATVTLRHLSV